MKKIKEGSQVRYTTTRGFRFSGKTTGKVIAILPAEMNPQSGFSGPIPYRRYVVADDRDGFETVHCLKELEKI